MSLSQCQTIWGAEKETHLLLLTKQGKLNVLHGFCLVFSIDSSH